jgi:DNA-3-methyladenine glycosylase
MKGKPEKFDEKHRVFKPDVEIDIKINWNENLRFLTMYIPRPRLKRPFYSRDTLTVARELIGKRLVHRSREGLTVGEIVETEAYIGPSDPASHAYQGRRTARTEVQFGPPGHAYIYLVHGMYHCFDITTGPLGRPEVVLIRSLRPLHGIKLMARRRGIELDITSCSVERKLRNLCNGPGKLCQAMGISKELHGIDICGNILYVEKGDRRVRSHEIAVTPRIGIEYAGEAKNYPWRFCLYDCVYVSKPVFRRNTERQTGSSLHPV